MTTAALIQNGVVARHSSETAEHYSPPAIVEAARQTLGAIDLDPASSAIANQCVKAAVWFGAESNGYIQPWHGRVFLNPPGGKMTSEGRALRKLEGKGTGYVFTDTGEPCKSSAISSAKAWWFKLALEFLEHRVTSAIFVGFSLEILQSTQANAPERGRLPIHCGLCVPSRRVAYVKPDGTIGASPPHASVIVHLCDDVEEKARFAAAFEKIGAVRQ